MAMRSIWKGYLRFSMVTIPIRLYNAVDSSTTIRFNQLHNKDHGRVGYDKSCKSCGETLGPEDIVKGYEFAPDEYVVVSGEEMKTLRLKSTRILEIEGFVPASEVHQTLFDTPYFVGPDGDVAGRGYALLAEALRKSRKMGIGKLVLRDREDMVLVGQHKGGLMVYKVRYPHVIRDIGEVPSLGGYEVLGIRVAVDDWQAGFPAYQALATKPHAGDQRRRSSPSGHRHGLDPIGSRLKWQNLCPTPKRYTWPDTSATSPSNHEAWTLVVHASMTMERATPCTTSSFLMPGRP